MNAQKALERKDLYEVVARIRRRRARGSQWAADAIAIRRAFIQSQSVLAEIQDMIMEPNGPLYGILPGSFLDRLESAIAVYKPVTAAPEKAVYEDVNTPGLCQDTELHEIRPCDCPGEGITKEDLDQGRGR